MICRSPALSSPTTGALLDPNDRAECEFEPFKPSALGGESAKCNREEQGWRLVYSPNTSEAVNAIFGNVSEAARTNYSIRFNREFAEPKGFNTDAEAIQAIASRPAGSGGCFLAVNFSGTGPAWNYSLRFDAVPGGASSGLFGATGTWQTSRTFPDSLGQGPRGNTGNGGSPPGYNVTMAFGTDDPGYQTHGFLFWQHLIDRAISTHANPSAAALFDKVELRRFAYPEYLSDGFLFAIQFGLPMFLFLSFFYTVLNISRSVVHEKEKKLKESMKMMGLRSWVHWSAWFAQYFLMMLVSILLICVVIKGGSILEHSDITLIAVFMLLYVSAAITFCFMLSSFFSKASNAAAGAGILWFVSYVPSFYVNRSYPTLTLGQKQSYCVILNTCMTLGANIISQQEGNGVGVTWATVADPISIDDPFRFGSVLVMLAVDTVVYFLIAWYLEGVWPGAFGIPKPWHFPASDVIRWCLPPGPRREPVGAPPASGAAVDPEDFESGAVGASAGLVLKQLRKAFGGKVAVEGSNLEMYEGQITALLGHNGAGKTTTMSMICGLFPPTAGTALVLGHDVRYEVNKAQRSLGICPQHDVLFDTLTVEEHLRFYCLLKGVLQESVQAQIDDMIGSLKLEEKRHAQSKTLSGGQRRRLSCGVALIGGSKVVILDEPTSGMDPAARRATWDLITKYKEGRTILLSTHFMDEADILGDRIAIMSAGQIRCCGSSMFLKRR